MSRARQHVSAGTVRKACGHVGTPLRRGVGAKRRGVCDLIRLSASSTTRNAAAAAAAAVPPPVVASRHCLHLRSSPAHHQTPSLAPHAADSLAPMLACCMLLAASLCVALVVQMRRLSHARARATLAQGVRMGGPGAEWRSYAARCNTHVQAACEGQQRSLSLLPIHHPRCCRLRPHRLQWRPPRSRRRRASP